MIEALICNALCEEYIPAKHKWLARNNELNTTTQTNKFVTTLRTCTPRETLRTYRDCFVNFCCIVLYVHLGRKLLHKIIQVYVAAK